MKLIIGSLLLVPTLVLAAEESGGIEHWKLIGVNAQNVNTIRKALEDADDVDTATIDVKTGNVTLKPDLGSSMDDKDIINAVSKIHGVTIAKVTD